MLARWILGSTISHRILKGPQPLYYGKNSPGGIVTIRTADPTDHFEAKVQAGYEFEAREVMLEGYVSVPLTDSLAEADGVYISRVDRLQELPESERLNPEQIVAELRAQGKPACYAASTDVIVNELTPQLLAGDVIGVFSNGGFGGIHDKLLARLRA